MTRSAAGFDLGPLERAERDRLANRLTAEERRVLLDQGTERPFCGTLLGQKAPGVYACRMHTGDGLHDAVVNAGVRPTFGEQVFAIEAHLLDFSGDLYDRRVRLDFVARLREEKKFSGIDALRAQIAEDVAAARRALSA